MNPRGDYSKVVGAAQSRLSRLISLSGTLPITRGPDAERLVSYLVIEAYSLWYGLNRSVFFSCAYEATHPRLGRVKTTFGRPLTTTDALNQAVWLSNSRKNGQYRNWSHRDEPSWGDQSAIAPLFRKLAPTNLGDLSSGWSVPTEVMKDLPTFRNFYAHKSEDSVVKAKKRYIKYSISSSYSPTEALLHRTPSKATPVVVGWLYDLQSVIGFY